MTSKPPRKTRVQETKPETKLEVKGEEAPVEIQPEVKAEVPEVASETPPEAAVEVAETVVEAPEVVDPATLTYYTLEEFARKENLQPFQKGVLKRNSGEFKRPLSEWIQARKRLIGG